MPVRKLNNASPFKLLGMTPDRTKTKHFTESALEADNLLRHIFNPLVKSIELQPLQIKFKFDGRIRRYTPDVAIKHIGTEELLIEEVKPLRIAQTVKFQRLEQAARSELERMGYRYAVVTEEIIRAQPRLTNLGILYRYHRYSATYSDMNKVFSWFSSGPKSLRTVRQLSNNADISIGVVFLLIANFHLQVNLDAHFNDNLLIERNNHG